MAADLDSLRNVARDQLAIAERSHKVLVWILVVASLALVAAVILGSLPPAQPAAVSTSQHCLPVLKELSRTPGSPTPECV